MAKGLILTNGIDIDGNWKDRMVVDQVPVATAPTTFAGALAAGGLLVNATTYYYVVTAIGIDGESIASTTELSFTPGAGNNSVAMTWDAQIYVTKYRVYRGTATGVYTGYIETGTNSLTDTGNPLAINTLITTPPATQPVRGLAVTHPVVGSYRCERSILLFSEITIHGYTYIPAFNDGVDIVPEKSILHLKKGKDMSFDINTLEVLSPAAWNTPGSDAGVIQALTTIEAWATTP